MSQSTHVTSSAQPSRATPPAQSARSSDTTGRPAWFDHPWIRCGTSLAMAVASAVACYLRSLGNASGLLVASAFILLIALVLGLLLVMNRSGIRQAPGHPSSPSGYGLSGQRFVGIFIVSMLPTATSITYNLPFGWVICGIIGAIGGWLLDPFLRKAHSSIAPIAPEIVQAYTGNTRTVAQWMSDHVIADGYSEIRVESLAHFTDLSIDEVNAAIAQLQRHSDAQVRRERGSSPDKDRYYVRLTPRATGDLSSQRPR